MDKTLKPTPKLAAAGVSGAATILVVYIASLFGLDIPEVPATAIGVLLTWAAGYFKADGKHAR